VIRPTTGRAYQAEIGRAFGVTREAVRQWLTAARKLLDTSG
jgi:DNA-directed RNA polymerase sigma subunit (sigma70/sigma32)